MSAGAEDGDAGADDEEDKGSGDGGVEHGGLQGCSELPENDKCA